MVLQPLKFMMMVLHVVILEKGPTVQLFEVASHAIVFGARLRGLYIHEFHSMLAQLMNGSLCHGLDYIDYI